MAQVRKGILEKIKGYSSTVTAFFSAGVVLFGAFTFISQGNQTAKSTRELKEVVNELNNAIEIFQENNAAEHSRIIKSLQETQEQVMDVKDNTNKWHRSYLQYVKDNTKSSDQLFRYLQGLNLEEVKRTRWWDTISPTISIKKIPTKQ